MLKQIIQFLKDEEGASAVEYGLIVGLIAVALVVILGTMGGKLNGLFETASAKIPGSTTTTTGN